MKKKKILFGLALASAALIGLASCSGRSDDGSATSSSTAAVSSSSSAASTSAPASSSTGASTQSSTAAGSSTAPTTTASATSTGDTTAPSTSEAAPSTGDTTPSTSNTAPSSSDNTPSASESTPAESSEAQKYNLTYVSEKGTAPEAKQASAITADDLAALTAEGYEFAGWYTDAAYTAKATAGAITADTTLYAKWETLIAKYEGFGGTTIEEAAKASVATENIYATCLPNITDSYGIDPSVALSEANNVSVNDAGALLVKDTGNGTTYVGVKASVNDSVVTVTTKIKISNFGSKWAILNVYGSSDEYIGSVYTDGAGKCFVMGTGETELATNGTPVTIAANTEYTFVLTINQQAGTINGTCNGTDIGTITVDCDSIGAIVYRSSSKNRDFTVESLKVTAFANKLEDVLSKYATKLDTLYATYDLTTYTVNGETLTAAYNDGKTAVAAATTAEAAYTAYTTAKAAMKAVKNDEAQALATAKANAIAELAAYKPADAAETDYTVEDETYGNKTSYANAIASENAKINACTSEEAVATALTAAKAVIDDVLTDAECLVAAKAAVKNYVDTTYPSTNYTLYVDIDGDIYGMRDNYEYYYDEMMDLIDSKTTVAEVLAIDFDDLNGLDTDAETLAALKEEVPQILSRYKNSNIEALDQTAWASIISQISSKKTTVGDEIAACDNATDIKTKFDNAVADIDALLLATTQTLDEAKATALKMLNNYVFGSDTAPETDAEKKTAVTAKFSLTIEFTSNYIVNTYDNNYSNISAAEDNAGAYNAKDLVITKVDGLIANYEAYLEATSYRYNEITAVQTNDSSLFAGGGALNSDYYDCSNKIGELTVSNPVNDLEAKVAVIKSKIDDLLTKVSNYEYIVTCKQCIESKDDIKVKFKYGTLPVIGDSAHVTVENATFAGWYIDPAYNTLAVLPEEPFYHGITLYAKWNSAVIEGNDATVTASLVSVAKSDSGKTTTSSFKSAESFTFKDSLNNNFTVSVSESVSNMVSDTNGLKLQKADATVSFTTTTKATVTIKLSIGSDDRSMTIALPGDTAPSITGLSRKMTAVNNQNTTGGVKYSASVSSNVITVTISNAPVGTYGIKSAGSYTVYVQSINVENIKTVNETTVENATLKYVTAGTEVSLDNLVDSITTKTGSAEAAAATATAVKVYESTSAGINTTPVTTLEAGKSYKVVVYCGLSSKTVDLQIPAGE